MLPTKISIGDILFKKRDLQKKLETERSVEIVENATHFFVVKFIIDGFHLTISE